MIARRTLQGGEAMADELWYAMNTPTCERTGVHIFLQKEGKFTETCHYCKKVIEAK